MVGSIPAVRQQESVASRLRPRRHALVVLQLAMASYRQEFVRALEASGEDILLLVGDRHFGDSVVTDVSSSLVERTGKNIYFLGRRGAYQRGCLGRGFLAKNLTIELNPRNLTSWLLLLGRLLTLRGTAAWGQAHSRRGPKPEHNRTRRIMQKLCSELITYTETETDELKIHFPGKTILPARNSVYTMAQMSQFSISDITDRPDLILIGRMVPEKKPLMGLEAFEKARDRLPAGTVLHIVGTGPEEPKMRDYVAKAGLSNHVRFYGWVSELAELAPIFQRCRGLLAPGYVGLNATQALVFGLVVLYPRDDPHSPEIEALDTTNSAVFESDDVEGCSKAITGLYIEDWQFDSEGFSKSTRSSYSTDRMIEPFVELARRG